MIEIILFAVVSWIVFFAFGYWCGKAATAENYERFINHLERMDRHGKDHI